MDLDADKHKGLAWRGLISFSIDTYDTRSSSQACLLCPHCFPDSSQGGNTDISASHPESFQQSVRIKVSNRLLASLPREVDKAAEADEHIHEPPRPFSECIQHLLYVQLHPAHVEKHRARVKAITPFHCFSFFWRSRVKKINITKYILPVECMHIY